MELEIKLDYNEIEDIKNKTTHVVCTHAGGLMPVSIYIDILELNSTVFNNEENVAVGRPNGLNLLQDRNGRSGAPTPSFRSRSSCSLRLCA